MTAPANSFRSLTQRHLPVAPNDDKLNRPTTGGSMSTPSTGAHRAHEYLRQAIASARSDAELNALEQLAHAHYGGIQLKELEAQIAVHREALSRPPSPPSEP